jgi:hypothetical protein
VSPLFYASLQSCTSCTLSPPFLCFTTHSCTSCTLSPLFLCFTTQCTEVQLCVVKHNKKRGDNVHEVQLCVVKHKTPLFYASLQNCTSCTLSPPFLCFTTYSCTSCTLSPLFYAPLQSCTSCTLSPLFLCFTTKLYFMYIVTSFSYSSVEEHKKEVTMYMKYSCM